MKCIVLYGNVSVYITIKCVAGNAGVHSKIVGSNPLKYCRTCEEWVSSNVHLRCFASTCYPRQILKESLFPDSPVVIYQSRHSKITVKFQQMGSIPKHQAPPRTSGGWSWLPISIANIRLWCRPPTPATGLPIEFQLGWQNPAICPDWWGTNIQLTGWCKLCLSHLQDKYLSGGDWHDQASWKPFTNKTCRLKYTNLVAFGVG